MTQLEISCFAARGANCSGLLGKKTLENEILREALARGEKIMRHRILVVAREVMLRSTSARWLMSAVTASSWQKASDVEVLAHHRVALMRNRSGSLALVESPGGISPPGAPRTVRDPLESHGLRFSAG